MTARPTLGALRRRAVNDDAPYRPTPALPAPRTRPTLGALRTGRMVITPAPDRVEALDLLRWSLAVDAARTIEALVATGWDRDEAAAVYRAQMLQLVDESIAFGSAWSRLTAAA